VPLAVPILATVPMTSLTISDSAYELILRELERSDIDDPAIALSYTRDTYPLPDEVLRLPREQRDKALEEYRAALRNVPHELRARVVSRSDVPLEWPASSWRSMVLLLAAVEGQNERLVPR